MRFKWTVNIVSDVKIWLCKIVSCFCSSSARISQQNRSHFSMRANIESQWRLVFAQRESVIVHCFGQIIIGCRQLSQLSCVALRKQVSVIILWYAFWQMFRGALRKFSWHNCRQPIPWCFDIAYPSDPMLIDR